MNINFSKERAFTLFAAGTAGNAAAFYSLHPKSSAFLFASWQIIGILGICGCFDFLRKK